MRACQAQDYREGRDCLARDWYNYLPYALPEVQWLLLPNLGPAIADYARDWSVDGLLITGGNDLGEEPLRDETEIALTDYALAEGLPIFGVCRGLQLVQHYYGGALSPCDFDLHVAADHEVVFGEDTTVPSGTRLTVNSYHAQAVRAEQLADPLRALATSDDGVVEGLYHPNEKIVAVQWHPERERPYHRTSRRLLREALGWAS